MAIGVSPSSISRLHENVLAGVPNLRLISSTTLGSKASSPRDNYHLDRGSMQGLCMRGELRADTKKGDCMGQPVNQNRTGRGFDLLMPHGAGGIPKRMGLFFGRRAVSAFLGCCDDTPTATSLQQHQFAHVPRESCSSPPQKVGFEGHDPRRYRVQMILISIAVPDIPSKCSTHDSR